MRRVIFGTILLVMAALGDRAAADNGTGVTTYHADRARTGRYTVPGLTAAVAAGAHMDTTFQGVVDGHIYAQPLYWHPPLQAHGRIIVATESARIYALDSQTGQVIWQTAIGPGVAKASLPCGDIHPLGISGTPVIDPETHAVYFDSMVIRPKGPQHLVFGVSLNDGSILPGWPINVSNALGRLGASFSALVENQRSALTIVQRRLYVSFAAHSGDCGGYHGWVAGFDIDTPQAIGAWSTRAQGGGIWSQSGIAFDGTSMFVATGNTIGASTWGDGEAILRLPVDLSHSTDTHDYFVPSNWLTLDKEDADVGGTGPVPLDVAGSGGTASLILGLGKDGNAYLADRTNLGGIGGGLATTKVSTGAIITAPAVYPGSTGQFVAFQGAGSNCPQGSGSGLTALLVTAAPQPAVSTAWCAALNGRGAPIVTTTDGSANPIVWATGAEGDNQLHGFDGVTGAAVFNGTAAAAQMTGLRHFSTILVAENRLYIGADGRVYAFGFHHP